MLHSYKFNFPTNKRTRCKIGVNCVLCFHTPFFKFLSYITLLSFVFFFSLFFLECTRRRTCLTLPILLFVVFSSGQWFSEILPKWPTHTENGGESGSGKLHRFTSTYSYDTSSACIYAFHVLHNLTKTILLQSKQSISTMMCLHIHIRTRWILFIS